MLKTRGRILPEVIVFEHKLFNDNRGSFLELFKESVFNKLCSVSDFKQDNLVTSSNNIIRGLHYQLNRPQGKLIKVISGSIIDVAVDIRDGSKNFGQYELIELNSNNNKMIYIPEGFAHGYLTKSDNTTVLYKCTNEYNQNDQYGISWDDPDIDIQWGIKSPALSEKDVKLPLLKDQKFLPVYE
tara:strand:+ start:368 stop:919 length:552 start_codon:yes stop_codon:yes gene_type:complete